MRESQAQVRRCQSQSDIVSSFCSLHQCRYRPSRAMDAVATAAESRCIPVCIVRDEAARLCTRHATMQLSIVFGRRPGGEEKGAVPLCVKISGIAMGSWW